MSIPSIDAVTLKHWLHDGTEIALFDVREAGEFGEGHLFFATPVPYSRLETEAVRLAPRRDVRLVVTDEDGGPIAALAARRLLDLGYTDVHLLQGGNTAWRAAGLALFQGINVPSKAFGELAELAYHTPRITAGQLAAWQREHKRHVLLDGRTVAEYRRMTIPGAVSCPNGELALRAHALIPDDDTPVVVNCAGRTQHHRRADAAQPRLAQPHLCAGERHPGLAITRPDAGVRCRSPLPGHDRRPGAPAGAGRRSGSFPPL